jgi:hypothetical protein
MVEILHGSRTNSSFVGFMLSALEKAGVCFFLPSGYCCAAANACWQKVARLLIDKTTGLWPTRPAAHAHNQQPYLAALSSILWWACAGVVTPHHPAGPSVLAGLISAGTLHNWQSMLQEADKSKYAVAKPGNFG